MKLFYFFNKQSCHVIGVLSHRLILFLFAVLSTLTIYAQPSNDNCASAEPLPVSGVNSGVCTDQTFRNRAGGGGDVANFATQEPGDPMPSCATSGDVAGGYNTVWFTFVAPNNGDLFLNLVGANGFAPVVSVYAGGCGAFTELACQRGTGTPSTSSMILNGLTPGNTYYIMVDGQGSQRGLFDICLKEMPNRNPADETSSGDCFSGTYLCNLDGFTMPASNNEGVGTVNEQIGNCGESETQGAFTNVDWYKFRATSNGVLNFTIRPNDGVSNFDFAVYEINGPTCGTKTTLACNVSTCRGNGGVTGLGCNAPGCRVGLFGRDVSPCENAVNIVSGREYAIQVKWKCVPTLVLFCGGNSGYSMDFSGSTFSVQDVGITDAGSPGGIGDRTLDFNLTTSCGGAVQTAHVLDDDWQFAWKTDETTLGNASAAYMPTFNFSTAGGHNVSLTVKDFPGGCTGRVSKNISIPTPRNVVVESPDTIICLGSAAQMRVNSNATIPGGTVLSGNPGGRLNIPDQVGFGVQDNSVWDGSNAIDNPGEIVQFQVNSLGGYCADAQQIQFFGNHGWRSDLGIAITNPCGQTMVVYYTSTAAITNPVINGASLISTTSPNTWAELRTCQTPGNWTFRFRDDERGITGYVDSVQIVYTTGIIPIQWTPAIGVSDVNVLEPIITPDTTRTYTLTVYDCVTKCYLSDEIVLNVVYTNNVNSILPIESCGLNPVPVQGVDSEPRAAGRSIWRVIEGDGFFGNPNTPNTVYNPTQSDLDRGFVRLDYFYPDPDYPLIGCDSSSTFGQRNAGEYPIVIMKQPDAIVPDTVEVCYLDTVGIKIDVGSLTNPTVVSSSVINTGFALSIPDVGTDAFNFDVNCASYTNWQVDSVCFQLDNGRYDDYRIDLISPNGVRVRLLDYLGNTRDNDRFNNDRFCFSSTAAANLPNDLAVIVQGGKYRSNQAMHNNAGDPNGTWRVEIEDIDTENVNAQRTDFIRYFSFFVTGDNSQRYTWFPNSEVDPNSIFTDSLLASPASSRDYSVLVEEANCCSRTYDVHVKVKPIPNSPLANDTVVCSGDTLRLTAIGDSSLYTYNWYSSNGLNYKDTNVIERDEYEATFGPNDFRAYYTTPVLNNLGTVDYDTALFVTAFDSVQGCNSLLDTINITIAPLPTFSNLPLTWDSICAGSNYLKGLLYDTVAYGGRLITTNWYNDSTVYLNIPTGLRQTNPINVNNVPNIGGSDSTAKISLYPSLVSTVVNGNSRVCAGDTTSIYFTVKSQPNIDSIRPVSQFVCYNDTIAEPTFFTNTDNYDISNFGSTNTTYKWYRSNDNVTGPGRSGGLNDTVVGLPGREGFVNTSNADQQVIITVIPERFGCVGADVTFQIDLAARPEFGNYTDTITVCSNTPDQISFNRLLSLDFDSIAIDWTLPAGIIDNYYATSDTVLVDPDFSSANNWVNGQMIFDFDFYNQGNDKDTVRFQAVAFHRGCTDTSNFVVIVNPIPVSTVSREITALCGNVGDSVAISFGSLVDETVDRIDFTTEQSADVSGTPLGAFALTNHTTDSTVNFNLYSTTAVNDTVLYKFVVTKYPELCAFEDTFKVVLYPQPVVDSLVYADSLCSGVPSELLVYSRTAGLDSVKYIFSGTESVTWNYPNDTIVVANNGVDNNADTLALEFYNPGIADSVITIQTITYNGQDACSDTALATIKIHPEPITTPSLADLSICSDYNDTVVLTTRVPFTDSIRVNLVGPIPAGFTVNFTDITLTGGNKFLPLTAINRSGNTINKLLFEATTYYKGCTYTDDFEVTVERFPEILNTYQNDTICNDVPYNVSLSDQLAPDSVRLIFEDNPNIEGDSIYSIKNTLADKNFTFNTRLQNTSLVLQTTKAILVSYFNSCTDSAEFLLSIIPDPRDYYIPRDTLLCYNEPLIFDLETTFQVDSILLKTPNNLIVTGGGVTSYVLPPSPVTVSDLLVNTDNVLRNLNISVETYVKGCVYIDNGIKINFAPELDFTNSLADVYLCGNEVFTNKISSGSVFLDSVIYTRTTNNPEISGLETDTVRDPNRDFILDLYNTGTDTLFETYTITNYYKGCTLDSVQDIYVKPDPVFRGGLSDTTIFVCSEDTITINFGTRIPADSIRYTTDLSQSTSSAIAGSVVTTSHFAADSAFAGNTREFSFNNTGNVADTLTFTAVSYAVGGCDDTITFSVVVGGSPVLDTILLPRVCGSELHTVNFVSRTATDSILFSTPFNSDVAGTPVNRKLGANVFSAPITLYNSTDSNVVVSFDVQSYRFGCVYETSFVDTIKPQPVIDSIHYTTDVCSDFVDTLVFFTRTENVDSTTYIRVLKNAVSWSLPSDTVTITDNGIGGRNDSLAVSFANPGIADSIFTLKVITYRDGCTDIEQINIKVLPKVTYEVNFFDGNNKIDSICSESDFQFRYTPDNTNISIDYTYTWINFDPQVTLIPDSSGTITATGDFFDPRQFIAVVDTQAYKTMYFETTVNYNGCSGDTLLDSIVVKPKPIAYFEAASPICITEEAILINMSTVYADDFANTTESWDFDFNVGPPTEDTTREAFDRIRVTWEAVPGVKKPELRVTYDGCVSDPFISPIQRDDNITIDLGADTVICMLQGIDKMIQLKGDTSAANSKPNAGGRWRLNTYNGGGITATVPGRPSAGVFFDDDSLYNATITVVDTGDYVLIWDYTAGSCNGAGARKYTFKATPTITSNIDTFLLCHEADMGSVLLSDNLYGNDGSAYTGSHPRAGVGYPELAFNYFNVYTVPGENSLPGLPANNSGVSGNPYVIPGVKTNNQFTQAGLPRIDTTYINAFTSLDGCNSDTLEIPVVVYPEITVQKDGFMDSLFCVGETAPVTPVISNIDSTTITFSLNTDLGNGLNGFLPKAVDTYIAVNADNTQEITGTYKVVADAYAVPGRNPAGCHSDTLVFTQTVLPDIASVMSQTGIVNDQDTLFVCNTAQFDDLLVTSTANQDSSILVWSNTNPSFSMPITPGDSALGGDRISSFLGNNPNKVEIYGDFDLRTYWTFENKVCPGDTHNFVVTIAPTVEYDEIKSGFPVNAICDTFTLSEKVLVGDAVPNSKFIPEFSWRVIGGASTGIPVLSGVDTIKAFNVANTGSEADTLFIEVTPTYRGCPGVIDTSYVRVLPTPILTITNDNEGICNDSSTTLIQFTSSVTDPNIANVFDWNLLAATKADTITTGQGDFVPRINVSPLRVEDTNYVSVTISADICPGIGDTVRFILYPRAIVETGLFDTTYCDETLVDPRVFGGVATQYDWINNNTGVGIAASGTSTAPDFEFPGFTTINANDTQKDTARITVTPVYKGCPGASEMFENIVNPVPKATFAANVKQQQLCYGIPTAAFNATNSVTVHPVDYVWEVRDRNFALDSTGIGFLASIDYKNNTNVEDTIYVIAIPTIDGCPGIPDTAQVIFLPKPGIANPPADQIFCVNAPTNLIEATDSVAGATFTWVNNKPQIGLPATGFVAAGNPMYIPVFDATNTNTFRDTAQVILLPDYKGCKGDEDTLLIMINPVLVVDPVADQVVCSNEQTEKVVFTSPNLPVPTFVWNIIDTAGLGGGGILLNSATLGNGTDTIFPYTTNHQLALNDSAIAKVIPQIGNCEGDTVMFKYIVKPTPRIAQLPDIEICEGEAYDIRFTKLVDSTLIEWTNVNVNVGIPASGTTDILSNAATIPGEVSLSAVTVRTRSTDRGKVCNGISETFSIAVSPQTVPGDALINFVKKDTVCINSNVQLSLKGNVGDNIIWQRRASGAGAFNALDNNVLVVDDIAIQDYEYRAQVTSGVCDFEFTDTVSVVVTDSTVVGSISANALDICSNEFLTVTLSGSRGAIVWEYSQGGKPFQPLDASVFNNPVLNFPDSLTQDIEIRAIVQSGKCPAGITNTLVIRVSQAPRADTLQIDKTEICFGESVTLTLDSLFGDEVWQKREFPLGDFQDMTAKGISISDLPDVGTWEYRVISVSGDICPEAISGLVRVTVNPTTNPGTITAFPSGTVCKDEAVTFSVTGETGTILGWEFSLDGDTYVPIAGTAGQNSITIDPIDTSKVVKVVVQRSTVCAVRDAVIKVDVSPFSQITTPIASANAICQGESVTLSVLNGYTGNLQWYTVDASGNLAAIVGETKPILIVSPTTTTTYAVGATSGACDEIISQTVTIQVDAPTVAGNLGVREFGSGDAYNYNSIRICIGSEVELEVSGQTGNVESWFATVSGRPSIELADKTLSIIDDPREETDYTVVIKNGTCPAASAKVNVKVDQRTNPGAVDAQSPICFGDTSELKIFGQRGTIDSLKQTLNGAFEHVDINSAPFTDSKLAPYDDTYYTMYVQNGVCPVDSFSFNIEVQDPVGMYFDDQDAYYCISENAITFNMFGGDGSTYELYYNYIHRIDGQFDTLSFVRTVNSRDSILIEPNSLGDGEGFYEFYLGQSGKCGTYFDEGVVVVYPPAIGNEVIDPVRCFGEANGSVTYDVVYGSGNYTYVWFNSDNDSIANTKDLDSLSAGDYRVAIFDNFATGCKSEKVFPIKQPDPLVLTRDSIQDVSCDGRPEGTLCYTVTGGNDIPSWGAHTYYWNKIDTNSVPFDTTELVDFRNQNCLSVLTDGIYHFDVFDARGCPISTVDTIRFVPVVKPDFEFALPDCDSLYTTLEVEENGEFEEWIVDPRGIITYSDTSDFVRRLDVERITDYEYIVTRKVRNEICESTFSNSVLFRANPVVDWDFFPKKPDVLDSRVIMTNFSDRDLDYVWTMYNPLYDVVDTISRNYSTNYQFDQGDSATYPVTLYGVNMLGCIDSLTKPIFVNGVFRIYTPNSFSPDNDGTNDIWKPVITGVEPTDYLLEVWDRWGKKVFSTTNPDQGWDGNYGGKKMAIGTYAWRVEFRDRYTVERIIRRGAVTIFK